MAGCCACVCVRGPIPPPPLPPCATLFVHHNPTLTPHSQHPRRRQAPLVPPGPLRAPCPPGKTPKAAARAGGVGRAGVGGCFGGGRACDVAAWQWWWAAVGGGAAGEGGGGVVCLFGWRLLRFFFLPPCMYVYAPPINHGIPANTQFHRTRAAAASTAAAAAAAPAPSPSAASMPMS